VLARRRLQLSQSCSRCRVLRVDGHVSNRIFARNCQIGPSISRCRDLALANLARDGQALASALRDFRLRHHKCGPRTSQSLDRSATYVRAQAGSLFHFSLIAFGAQCIPISGAPPCAVSAATLLGVCGGEPPARRQLLAMAYQSDRGSRIRTGSMRRRKDSRRRLPSSIETPSNLHALRATSFETIDNRSRMSSS
jgi:hypothetical protein